MQLKIVQDVVDIIGGRWRSAVLASLCDKAKRFNELKRDVGNVTPRILVKELKYLEMNMLIERMLDDGKTTPLYKLTEHGESLNPLIYAIVLWGQEHREKIFGKPLLQVSSESVLTKHTFSKVPDYQEIP